MILVAVGLVVWLAVAVVVAALCRIAALADRGESLPVVTQACPAATVERIRRVPPRARLRVGH